MHKDYIKKQEIFKGLLPSADAIEVIDYYAKGKSVADVQGLLRINSNKVSLSVIKTVYSHIKIIEDTMIRMLNGTSIVYNPPLDENGDVLFAALIMPLTKEDLLNNIMFTIAFDDGGFANVYDADFGELTSQISKVIDNIIATQSGSFKDLRDALKPE